MLDQSFEKASMHKNRGVCDKVIRSAGISMGDMMCQYNNKLIPEHSYLPDDEEENRDFFNRYSNKYKCKINCDKINQAR